MVESGEFETIGLSVAPIDLSAHYASCLKAFREHLVYCAGLPSTTPEAFPRGLIDKGLREHGRLCVWGDETRASLPSATRGSLDDTLRNDTEMKGTVADILMKIKEQLQHTADMLRHAQTRKDKTEDGDYSSSESDESLSESSEEDSPEFSLTQHCKIRSLIRFYRRIKEDIDTLYQVSLLIKRTGYSRKYVHSTSESRLKDKVEHFQTFDISHIQEKILDWARQGQRNETETNITTDVVDIATGVFPAVTKSIVHRLAKANTKRREQLLYWAEHPDQAPLPVPSQEALVNIQDVDDSPMEAMTSKLSKLDIEEAAQAPQDQESRKELKSTVTKTTFSSVAMSNMFDPDSSTIPAQTIYAESMIGRHGTNRVPDIPKKSLTSATFNCPYCHLQLTSEHMRNRQEWKRHVYRDLRPYVCTFSDCQNPDRQYAKRHDWAFHETQMHRRRWVCEEHDRSFASKTSFISHVNASHLDSFTPEQLPILVNLSERPADEMEIVSCPLCPDKRRLMLHHAHLAEHLESIALFVLPSGGWEDDDEIANSKLVTNPYAPKASTARSVVSDNESEAIELLEESSAALFHNLRSSPRDGT